MIFRSKIGYGHLQLDDFFIIGECGRAKPLPFIGLAAPPKRLDIVGLKVERFVEIVERRVGLPLRQKNMAACRSRRCVGCIEGNRLVRVGFGFPNVARYKTRLSPVIIRIRIVGLEAHGFVEIRDGAIMVALP